MKKNWKTGVCRTVLALSISLAAVGIAMAEEGGDTVFVPGTSVNGLGIADLTVDEAAERIGSFYTKDYTLTIKERGGKQETITGEQIGFSVKLPDGFLQEKLNQQNAGGRVFGPDVDNRYGQQFSERTAGTEHSGSGLHYRKRGNGSSRCPDF